MMSSRSALRQASRQLGAISASGRVASDMNIYWTKVIRKSPVKDLHRMGETDKKDLLGNDLGDARVSA